CCLYAITECYKKPFISGKTARKPSLKNEAQPQSESGARNSSSKKFVDTKTNINDHHQILLYNYTHSPFSFRIPLTTQMDSSSDLVNNHRLLRRLRCSVQHYDWGITGKDNSLVSRLYALNSGSAQIPLNKPYAEFWMGIHGSAPSFVLLDTTGRTTGNNGEIDSDCALSLKDWIVQNPCVLGDKVFNNWGSDLPFLFKILSVGKALSIQAHPDKELAKKLHKLHPNIYKDENHKPEMALAITEFEALCGFVSFEELKDVLCNIPEITELIDSKDTNQLLEINHKVEGEKVKSILRSIFTQLMSASKEMTTKAVCKLKIRLQMQSQVQQLTDKENLVLKLEKQYPDDIGVISAFFLNHVKLKPGQALYLGENEPHAYISGDCIEVMATSDNVVRAGLTPKLRDVPTLCSMLTYKQGFPEILKGFPLSPYVTRYLPPFEEFEVDHCFLPKGATTVFPAVEGPSIFVITGGDGAMQEGSSSLRDVVMEGDVIFAPAGIQIEVKTVSELHLYRAGVNSRFLQTL
ncbi:Mannose-6-phosphate isomerase 2, partial [Linum grandiflorum]